MVVRMPSFLEGGSVRLLTCSPLMPEAPPARPGHWAHVGDACGFHYPESGVDLVVCLRVPLGCSPISASPSPIPAPFEQRAGCRFCGRSLAGPWAGSSIPWVGQGLAGCFSPSWRECPGARGDGENQPDPAGAERACPAAGPPVPDSREVHRSRRHRAPCCCRTCGSMPRSRACVES